ncbi:MAG: class I SAM-dependent DNA methyltransferase [Acidobacteria bacterium]|nr:class I SAM-dependent DNA methyltransferase [Acidobacteriota bacterium]
MPMTIDEFIQKWRRVELTERSASQQHFLDLCEVFGHAKPAEADPTGEWFTFERGAAKHGGSKGWADVWKRGSFAFEYKGKHKNLEAAYDQLLQYREALENPPLLVVCDMERLVVHTNFTATVAEVHDIALLDFNRPRNLEILRAIFKDPERLRPGVTSKTITTEVARQVGDMAQGLRERGFDASEVARFLDRIVFCLFAEDVGLLPERLFTRLVEKSGRDPQRFSKTIGRLFDAMREGSDDFGLETIAHFNGNLFTDSPVLTLTPEEIESLDRAARLDWKAVDPAIFGTLFERGLDPAKRAQLGAQYTSREDIETLIEPVVLRPLRAEWEALKERANELLAADDEERERKRRAETRDAERFLLREATDKAFAEAQALVRGFHERLAAVRVLDPACGSGNFLYVTLQHLKDLEKEVLLYARDCRLGNLKPLVSPLQFYGIEVNPYAFDLAQTTLWIGYLQWIRANGYGTPAEPILRSLEHNFRNMDAILDLSDADNPREPEWPAVDFIVGNPPFLGGKRLRAELGDEYVNKLFALWKGRVPAEADLCCYFFERARKQVEDGSKRRAGLLATQGIRGGANREVLKRIKETGDIFFAESDRPWVLNGANVHVSMVGFDDGSDVRRVLDGSEVAVINSNLASDADVTQARTLEVNSQIAFMGDTKGGAFDINEDVARSMFDTPNPHGIPNSSVILPWVNGLDITRRPRDMFIIDFGVEMSEAQASLFEAPFAHVEKNVLPERKNNKREAYRKYWWRHVEARPKMLAALSGLPRFIATLTVSKHRLFAWMKAPTLPDHQLIVFARSDDYFFGVLHSRIHEVWARSQGTQVRERESGFRYTPTTCFETFPFPKPSPAQEALIADAARRLDELRSAWLNPPEWTREEVLEFRGSNGGAWAAYVHDADERGVGLVRYPRLVPRDPEAAAQLAKRTLTNLYNERPTWLDLAHRELDAAVCAAYGWPHDISDTDVLAQLLDLNLRRAEQTPAPPEA